ncbi:hypothetical protein V7S43_018306 [Phytophthora oleae]|uniref:GST C-terminal domain-containing protein n=1 Tax=Phytophthora oleae TaxID=2107226 RepID=A0ABD3EQM8_9STRA
MSKPAPYDFQIEPNVDAQFPSEKGRYHLYVTYACPFACRALAARNLKGLQYIVGLSVALPVPHKTKPNDPADTHMGWVFVDPEATPTITGIDGKSYSTEGCIPDTVNHVATVRELYEKVDPAPRPFSVPVLWDTKKETIVSEQSAGILRTLDSGFRDVVQSEVQLYPEELQTEIDAANDSVVADVTTRLLKKLMARTPEEAQAAMVFAFAAIEKLDEMLANTRYLVGQTVTEADVRMFHSLIRLDVSQQKHDEKHLTDYANVVGYLRDLYQIGLNSSVNWDHVKLGVESKCPVVIANGPFVDYTTAHKRG